MNTNFINRGGRTYLVQNPNQFGQGIDLGYYRDDFSGVKAVSLKPFHQEKEFGIDCEKEAMIWLRQQSGV